jgi:branched-chain amino acid transport system ATP-binding protein
LALRDVRFRYGGITAIDGVTLELADREILGIIGSNGAGKTTLLDVCSGFLTVDTGRVELDGADVTHLTAAARAELGLGRSFQDARLFPSLTVREAVATALERHVEVRDPLLCLFHTGSLIESERVVAGRAGELIEMLGLGRYQDAFVSELSTGTRRIVELACALAHEPRALLLDEPSSGIAQREGEALAELLLEVRHQTGAALLVVEHDIPLVSSISDRLICLELGAVISDGQPSEVLADPLVIASYLGTDPAAWKRSGNGSSDSTRAKTRARRAQPAAGHRVAPSRAPG